LFFNFLRWLRLTTSAMTRILMPHVPCVFGPGGTPRPPPLLTSLSPSLFTSMPNFLQGTPLSTSVSYPNMCTVLGASSSGALMCGGTGTEPVLQIYSSSPTCMGTGSSISSGLLAMNVCTRSETSANNWVKPTCVVGTFTPPTQGYVVTRYTGATCPATQPSFTQA